MIALFQKLYLMEVKFLNLLNNMSMILLKKHGFSKLVIKWIAAVAILIIVIVGVIAMGLFHNLSIGISQLLLDSYSFKSSWGSKGTAKDIFYELSGIAIDSSGNVYVTDQTTDRIIVFTPIP